MVTLLLIFFLLCTVGLLFVIISSFWGFLITRVPYVRSNTRDTALLLSKIPMSGNDIFYDLGSGDGRVVFLAEQMYGVSGLGFETTLWVYWHALLKRYLRKSGIRFERKNFFKESWSEATIVYCYLYPPLMRSVEMKFLEDCAPGTVLISRDFPLPGLRPQEIVDFNSTHNTYIYRKQ